MNKWIAAVAVMVCLSACASTPPHVPVTPVVGGALQSVRQAYGQSGGSFRTSYQLEARGHQFTVAIAKADVLHEVIFVDGHVACAQKVSAEAVSTDQRDATQWERVSTPGGLEYIADNLLEACGMTERTLARQGVPAEGTTLPASANAEDREPASTEQVAEGTTLPASANAEDREPASTEQVKSTRIGREIGKGLFDVAATTAVVLVGMVLFPVALPAAAVISMLPKGATDKPWLQSETGYLIRLGMSQEEITSIFGRPEVDFLLPDVATTVLAYNSLDAAASITMGGYTSCYIGVAGNRAVWIHYQNSWLKDLAEKAIDKRKKQERAEEWASDHLQ
jgi:hypothetical protein